MLQRTISLSLSFPLFSFPFFSTGQVGVRAPRIYSLGFSVHISFGNTYSSIISDCPSQGPPVVHSSSFSLVSSSSFPSPFLVFPSTPSLPRTRALRLCRLFRMPSYPLSRRRRKARAVHDENKRDEGPGGSAGIVLPLNMVGAGMYEA